MGLEWVVMRASANCNVLRKVVLVWRQVGVCTWFQEGCGGVVASVAHVLILISHSLYIFRSLRRKISVKPAVKCHAQYFISTWAPCYTQSAQSVWCTSVAWNTSHITLFWSGLIPIATHHITTRTKYGATLRHNFCEVFRRRKKALVQFFE
jgi:hypothetical protein